MLVQQGYKPSEKEQKTLIKVVPVKEEMSFMNMSVKARVIDLPYTCTENAKEIVKHDPYVKEKVVFVENKKNKNMLAVEDDEHVKGKKPGSHLPEKVFVFYTKELSDTNSEDDAASFLLPAPKRCIGLLCEVIKYNETGVKILKWLHKKIEASSLCGGDDITKEEEDEAFGVLIMDVENKSAQLTRIKLLKALRKGQKI